MTRARPSRRRRALRLTAALSLVGALAGCTADESFHSTSVISYTEGRTRYLDATCALRAQADFWRPIAWSGRADADRTAEAVLPAAGHALARLTGNRRPYPEQLAVPVAALVRTIETNRDYFQAARTATSAADLAKAAQPQAVPASAVASIEQVVFVSSAPGSANCTGHGLAASTPTPTSSPS